MDLHQAFCILPRPVGGILSLEEPGLAREAAPLTGLHVWEASADATHPVPGLYRETVGLTSGGFLEFSIPAWSACALVVHAGFCQTGTDGDSPDAHAGEIVIYRRRNRVSALVLAAGPDGFNATLFIAPRQPDAGP